MTSNPKKRSALGKGLGALLDNANTDITTTTTGVTGGVSLLPISAIEAIHLIHVQTLKKKR
jgi:hypothetical protein